MMAVIAWKDEWADIEEFCLDDVCIVWVGGESWLEEQWRTRSEEADKSDWAEVASDCFIRRGGLARRLDQGLPLCDLEHGLQRHCSGIKLGSRWRYIF